MRSFPSLAPTMLLSAIALSSCGDTPQAPSASARLEAPPGFTATVARAPIAPDGDVTGRPTDLVISFDTPLDPSVPGRSLAPGRTIRISLPDAFVPDGRPIQSYPCPIMTDCNTAALLQGWPQNPLPFAKYGLAYDGPQTVVITAQDSLAPAGPASPGIKQVHLILRGFTNPAPGRYPIRIVTETGPGGAVETATAWLTVAPFDRPTIAVVSATPDNPPPRKDKIFQTTAPGALAPLPLDFLLWDADGAPLVGVELVRADIVDPARESYHLVRDGRVLGLVEVDAPFGATGQELSATGATVPFAAPVSGIPAALLRTWFRAGSQRGEYLVRFSLTGGNAVEMHVRAE